MKPPSRYHMQLFKIQSEKFENFNMKQIKNDEFQNNLKTFKSAFVVLKKFQCIFFFNF